jgi:hypothetical protein
MGGQRPLHFERAQQGLPGPAEHREEGVALGVDLMPVVTGDGGADQLPVLRQDLRIPFP